MTATHTPSALYDLHRFSSVGYDIIVALDPDAGAPDIEFVTYLSGMVTDRQMLVHESQAAAIAYAANLVLADVAAETGFAPTHTVKAVKS